MGYSKVGVTASEMMHMREQGMSNHDIAKSLDICEATVYNYIGKQGGRMERLEAFRDTTPKIKETPCVEENMEEKVDHPAHYQGKNECIDVMLAMFGKEAVKHFCMCNAYKYRYRAALKNGEEDIKKAEWYETKLIELGGVDES